MGAAAAASLVMVAPAAVAAEPQTKLVRLLDACDKETWDAAGAGICNVDAGSVTFDRFVADLQKGGSGAWWINNRKDTIDAGDKLSVVNQGGIVHSFTEVRSFGQGIVPPWNAAVKETVPAVTVGGTPVGQNPADFGTIVAPGATPLEITPAKGVHNYQCIIHPWMRSVITVR
jgi:plastocyanin